MGRENRPVRGGAAPLMPSAVAAHELSVGHRVFVVSLEMRFLLNLDGAPGLLVSIQDGAPVTTPRALPKLLFLPPDLQAALRCMWASSLCSLEKVRCPPAGLCSSKSTSHCL